MAYPFDDPFAPQAGVVPPWADPVMGQFSAPPQEVMPDIEDFYQPPEAQPMPNDFFARLAQSQGPRPFQFQPRQGRNARGIDVILAGLQGFANARAAQGAQRTQQVQDENAAAKENARQLAYWRHKKATEARMTAKNQADIEATRQKEWEARRERDRNYVRGVARDKELAQHRKDLLDLRRNPPQQGGGGIKDINTLVDNMRQDPDIKDFFVVRDNYKRVLTSSQSKTGQGDMAVIFSYMRVLDPNSVVRESEYKTAADAIGNIPALTNTPRRWIQGDKLTEEGRQGFLNETRKLYQAKLRDHSKARSFYEQQARAVGVDPKMILRDMAADEIDERSGASTGGGAGVGGQQSPGQTVRMKAPDGRTLAVPPSDVARMKSLGAVEF